MGVVFRSQEWKRGVVLRYLEELRWSNSSFVSVHLLLSSMWIISYNAPIVLRLVEWKSGSEQCQGTQTRKGWRRARDWLLKMRKLSTLLGIPEEQCPSKVPLLALDVGVWAYCRHFCRCVAVPHSSFLLPCYLTGLSHLVGFTHKDSFAFLPTLVDSSFSLSLCSLRPHTLGA